jgi:hypothetical protein
VRLVGIDGHAGSGKSTFTHRIAAALGGAPVVHLDDLATHEELFAWTDRFTRQVLTPLSHGRTARFAAYDWDRRSFSRTEHVPPAPVVLIEGVGAGRRALRPHLACLLWMEVPARAAWERGRLRDGAALSGFWDAWERAELRHFTADPSRPHAALLALQGTGGWTLLPGLVPGPATGTETGPADPREPSRDVTPCAGPTASRNSGTGYCGQA